MVITIDSVSIIDNKMIIKGSGENLPEKFRIAFRERNSDHEGLFFKSLIQLGLQWKENKFEGIIDLNEYKEALTVNRIWDLYIIDEKFNRYGCKISEDNLENINNECLIKDRHINIVIRATKNNTLCMDIKPNIFMKLVELDLSNNKGHLAFELLDKDKKNLDINEVYVSAKKRLTRDIFNYNDEVLLKANKQDNQYTLDMDINEILENLDINNNDAMDCFLVLKNESNKKIELTFSINEAVKNEYTILNSNKLYEGMFYKNYKNQLALLIRKRSIDAKLDFIEIDEDGNLLIEGCIQGDIDGYNQKIESLVIYPKVYVKGIYKNSYTLRINGNIKENDFKFDVNLGEILAKVCKNDLMEFNVGIEITNLTNNKIDILNIKSDILKNKVKSFKRIDNNYEISYKSDEENDLVLELKNRVKNSEYETIKISILGSCMSRGAFTSSDYFNPTYKSKYRVVDTNFHMSLMSTVSEKIENSDEIVDEYFEYLHPVHKEYVRKDFKKDFFKSLEENKIDFLIVDFYQDAVRDLVVYDDNKIISGSIYLRDSEYLDKISDKATIITHNQGKEYLSYWEKAIEKFAKEIVKYIPQERIILNNAYSLNDYFDKDGNKTHFKTLGNFVKRNNYFFDYMNKSFIANLPKINVIDLTKHGFIPSANHPEKVTPTHYQTEYYKEFMNDLDDIVLRTLLKEANIKLR